MLAVRRWLNAPSTTLSTSSTDRFRTRLLVRRSKPFHTLHASAATSRSNDRSSSSGSSSGGGDRFAATQRALNVLAREQLSGGKPKRPARKSLQPHPPATATAAAAATTGGAAVGPASPAVVNTSRLSISQIRRALRSGIGPVADRLREMLHVAPLSPAQTAAATAAVTAGATSGGGMNNAALRVGPSVFTGLSGSRIPAIAAQNFRRSGSSNGSGSGRGDVVYVDLKVELETLERQSAADPHSGGLSKYQLRSAYGSLLVHAYKRLLAAKQMTILRGGSSGDTATAAASEFEPVKRVWNSFVRRSTPSPSHYTIFMQSHAAVGDLIGAEQVYRRVVASKTVKADAFVYNSLINIFVQSNRLADAERILQDLLRDSQHKPLLHPDMFSFAPLIIAHAQRPGGLPDALRLFRDTKSRGLRITHVVYAAVMSAYARDGNSRAVELLFDEMKVRRIFPTRYNTAALIEAYGRSGDLASAERVVWTDMPERYKLRPTRSSFVALMEAVVRAGELKRVIPMLKTMRDFNAKLNASADSSAQSHNSASRDSKTAADPSGWPDPVVYYATLRALGESNSSRAMAIAFDVITHGLHSGELPPLLERRGRTAVLDLRPYAPDAALYPVLYTLTVQSLLLAEQSQLNAAKRRDKRQLFDPTGARTGEISGRGAKRLGTRRGGTDDSNGADSEEVPDFAKVQALHSGSSNGTGSGATELSGSDNGSTASSGGVVLTDALRKQFYVPNQLFVITGKRQTNAFAAATAAAAAPGVDPDEALGGDTEAEGMQRADQSQRQRHPNAERDRTFAEFDITADMADDPEHVSVSASVSSSAPGHGFVLDSRRLSAALRDGLARVRPPLITLESVRTNPGQLLVSRPHLLTHLRALWKGRHTLLAPIASALIQTTTPTPTTDLAVAAVSPGRRPAGSAMASGSGSGSGFSPISSVGARRVNSSAAPTATPPPEADDEDAVLERLDIAAQQSARAAQPVAGEGSNHRSQRLRKYVSGVHSRIEHQTTINEMMADGSAETREGGELSRMSHSLRGLIRKKAKQVIAKSGDPVLTASASTSTSASARRPGSGGQSIPSALLKALDHKLASLDPQHNAKLAATRASAAEEAAYTISGIDVPREQRGQQRNARARRARSADSPY